MMIPGTGPGVKASPDSDFGLNPRPSRPKPILTARIRQGLPREARVAYHFLPGGPSVCRPHTERKAS